MRSPYAMAGDRLARTVSLCLLLGVAISIPSVLAAATAANGARGGGRAWNQHRHAPLAHIEATMLTTAAADFGGSQEAYTTATDWHEKRLIEHHGHATAAVASERSARTTKRGNDKQDFAEEEQNLLNNRSPQRHAPYLACARYKNGGRALSSLKAHFGQNPRSTRTVSHTEEHGACFLVTSTPDAASAVSSDLDAFGLWSFGPLPSILKLAPGLLEHGPEPNAGEHVGGAGEPQQTKKDTLNNVRERLTTTHGDIMQYDNVMGLNLELTPGILRSSSTSKKLNGNKSANLAAESGRASTAADALSKRLQDGLMSESLDLYRTNFWSEKDLVEEHMDRSEGSAVRARAWTRAARVVHSGMHGDDDEKSIGKSVGERCGWDGVRFHHAGDDLLLVLGMDHVLPSHVHSTEDAKELQMACFMGLLSYFADRPEVLRVSSLHMPAPLNAVARALIQSGNVVDTPLSDAGLDGTGEVVQVVDSGIDETSCFFIDDDGEEIEHGYYFEELAFVSSSSASGELIIFNGGSYPVDTSRRKIVQYIELIRADVAGSSQPYGDGPITSIYWYSASGFEEDDLDGHGTHTAGSVAGATLDSPATVPTCNGTDELGCAGGCLNATTIAILEDPDAEWDIDGYCPRFDCVGGDAATDECLSDDTAEVLTQHGGVARGAKLAIFDAAAGIGFYTSFVGNDLWEMTEETGAKIHSNSWGAVAGCLHQPSAALYDEYMYQNPEHLLVFAAGNDGNFSNDPTYDTCSMASPAIAKNILAVGATSTGASRKPSTSVNGLGGYAPADDPADIDTIAWFSSRGPTIDNRIKPEIVAPGDQIFSAASDGEDSNSCRLYATAGTSMACPLVAGASALIRQYFLDESFYVADLETRGLCGSDSIFACDTFSPSAATIKMVRLEPIHVDPACDLERVAIAASSALILNSADLLGGSSEPDGDRGFGRIYLEAGMPLNGDGNFTLFVADSVSIAELTEDVYTFETSSDNSSTGVEIRATLSWLDPPSAVYAAKQLQHDLDLSVTSPSGVSYVMWQTSGLKDSANNNERVIVPVADAAESGEWTVTVSANALTTESQDYSLVVTAGNVVGGEVAEGAEAGGEGGSSRGSRMVSAIGFSSIGLWTSVATLVWFWYAYGVAR